MFPLLLLLFDMYTRTIILQRGIISRETKQPYSLLVFRDERGIVHRVETTDDIWSLEDFPEGPIDHLAYQPSWLPCWTEWQGDPSTVFIKEADYFNPPNVAQASRETTVREICILEHLRQHPHPNICPYLGCLVSPTDKHVQSLVFKQLDVTLAEVVLKIRFDRAVGRELRPHPPLDNVISDIRSAIAHLQSLGYLYTDVKGHNVMWDPTARHWCLIDFSECYSPGTKFTHGVSGTPGWIDPDARVVTVELVESMLVKLEEYVRTGLEPLPREITRDEHNANFDRNVATAIAVKAAVAKTSVPA